MSDEDCFSSPMPEDIESFVVKFANREYSFKKVDLERKEDLK